MSTWPDAAVWRADSGADELEEGRPGAWCDHCGARRDFAVLSDIGGRDPTWTYWSCNVCGAVPDECPWVACGCGRIIDCWHA